MTFNLEIKSKSEKKLFKIRDKDKTTIIESKIKSDKL